MQFSRNTVRCIAQTVREVQSTGQDALCFDALQTAGLLLNRGPLSAIALITREGFPFQGGGRNSCKSEAAEDKLTLSEIYFVYSGAQFWPDLGF